MQVCIRGRKVDGLAAKEGVWVKATIEDGYCVCHTDWPDIQETRLTHVDSKDVRAALSSSLM